MGTADVERDDVLCAIAEFGDVGRDAFLERYGFERARFFHVLHDHRLFDAKAVLGAAHRFTRFETPLAHTEFSGGEQTNGRLRSLGFQVIDLRSADDERTWRHEIWLYLQSEGAEAIPPKLLNGLGVFSGGRGIWRDKERTKVLADDGVTVAVLHTEGKYADELQDDTLLYHYPVTERPSTDAGDVEATKNAARLGLPIFVVVKPSPNAAVRKVALGYVEDWDDSQQEFLIAFSATGGALPVEVKVPEQIEDAPFRLAEGGSTKARLAAARLGQQRFSFRVRKRYGERCAVSDIAVPAMLEAVHICPFADGGTHDPRNGLVMSAAHHRAFDAHLFSIHPETLEILMRPGGPTLQQMGITRTDLRHLPNLPHPEALRHRYEEWQKVVGLMEQAPGEPATRSG